MFQTAYRGIAPLHRNASFNGGICKFYYIPIEDVAGFPRISAETQYLVDEPLLKEGKAWFGPIRLPKDRLGFTETLKRDAAGIYYEIRVNSFHLGDSKDSRVNLQNMPYHRYLVAAKVRAGGFWILIGTLDSYCKFNADFTTGNGPGEDSSSQFAFTTEQKPKALILPSFSADKLSPSTGGNGGGDDMSNNKEIISFEDSSTVSIIWTDNRRARFGSYPLIEIWLKDGDDHYLHLAGEIKPDAPPPGFTELTVKLGGINTGYIVIG